MTAAAYLGAVTEFVFELHPLNARVLSFDCFYAPDDGERALRAFREIALAAPEETTLEAIRAALAEQFGFADHDALVRAAERGEWTSCSSTETSTMAVLDAEPAST